MSMWARSVDRNNVALPRRAAWDNDPSIDDDVMCGPNWKRIAHAGICRREVSDDVIRDRGTAR